jgi:16S rRNA (uracil1498-N3)-methyltransferase
MSTPPRLFLEGHLAGGGEAVLSDDQSHYLLNVMRLQPGAHLRVFSTGAGEFEAQVARAERRRAVISLGRRLRSPSAAYDLELLFVPLKKTRTDFLIEKTTELGVRTLQPVYTERCEAQNVRTDRFHRIAVEASEQCERLCIPEVRDPASLETLLATWSPERVLLFCDESGDAALDAWGGGEGRADPLSDVLSRETPKDRVSVLIGPEGGFSPVERQRLRAQPYVIPVSLGPRILRAETAAIAALTLVQSTWGDLRRQLT